MGKEKTLKRIVKTPKAPQEELHRLWVSRRDCRGRGGISLQSHRSMVGSPAGISRNLTESGCEGGHGTKELLGSGDIQSLADVVNCIAAIREMRPVPSGLNTVITLVPATLSPLLPLTLTIFSAEEVLLKIIQMLLRSCRAVASTGPGART
jgi:hypothetical protein